MIASDYWQNSQMSVAKYYGGLQYNGKEYKIVNKDGITVEELSNPQSKNYVGNGKYAIPPGEPADLVMKDWLPVYRKLGRAEFIKILEKKVSLKSALALINQK